MAPPRPSVKPSVLMVRGAQMFLGYHKRPDLEPFDAEGWFDTGDLAYIDDEGYIRINGRIKDVVIRGGENVPVVEIENLLFKHPAVLAAALVGYPDSRLGERVCAFVVLRTGHALDLKAVQAYMADHKVAKQYWPERVEIVADLPKTPAGKVQKFRLARKGEGVRRPRSEGESLSARLKDRVCVVTGAARGIGLAIAERFGREGGRARRRGRQRAPAGTGRRGPQGEGL